MESFFGNVVIKAEDYELYRINIEKSNVLKLLGKTKNKYIYSELEKRHPCFCNEWAFDTKLMLNKKEFFYNVVVIYKAKLAEYQNKSSTVTSFTLECPTTSASTNFYKASPLPQTKLSTMLYAAKNILQPAFYRIWSFLTAQTYFNNNSFIKKLFMLFLLLTALSLVGVRLEDKKSVLPQTQSNITSAQQRTYKNFSLQELLTFVKTMNGKFLFFDADFRNNFVSVELKVKGMQPEDLQNFFDKSELFYMNYEEGSPNFFMKGRVELPQTNGIATGPVKNLLRKEFRDELVKNGIINFGESTNENAFKFIAEKKQIKKLAQLFDSLDELLHKNNSSLKKITVQKDSKGALTFYAGLSAVSETNMYFKDVKEVLELFEISTLEDEKSQSRETGQSKSVSGKNVQTNDTSDFKGSLTIEKTQANRTGVKKIGEITHQDGKKVIYYKDSKGKLVIEESGGVNE